MANLDFEKLVKEDDKLNQEESFKPTKVLDVKNVDKRFRYRWVREKNVNPLTGKDDRGWEKVTQLENSGEKGNVSSGIVDKSLDGSIRANELVLARMSKERAEARTKYYRDRNDARVNMIKTASSEIRKTGLGSEYELEIKKDGKTHREKG